MKPDWRPVKIARDAVARLLRDVRGATAVEYGLIVALIVIAMVVALIQLGTVTGGMWNNTSAKVQAAS